MMKVPVSILIPVRNEEANLPRCLAAVCWADEVIVVDSQSTDETVALASAGGAQVVQFHFNGRWPKKKNWALENIPFRHEWVFILDADEVMPPEAEAEIKQIVTGVTPHAGYWINRRFMFMGRWLRHSYYPNWNLRLFKHRCGRYEKITDAPTASGDNEVHEHVVMRGSTGHLRSELDHYAFPSVEVFVEKHNRYSNWEARVAVEPHSRPETLQSGAVSWRRCLKELTRDLPGRPLLRFLYIYVAQLGFLDGREGYYFARLHAYYEFLSLAKEYELRKSLPATAANEMPRVWRVAFATMFTLFLAVVLFFTLRPSGHGERTAGLPVSVGRWINRHDEWSNFGAFTILAFFWFVVELPLTATRSWWGTVLAAIQPRRTRLAIFCALMIAIEFVQFLIPGRVYDLKDIAAGWMAALVGLGLWRWSTRLWARPRQTPAPPESTNTSSSTPVGSVLL